MVCFWWDVPFHLKTFVFFPPENWASKAFFKIYFEAKSAIILSSFNQTWLVFQYTHSLNEILKRWLPSGVILFNFIKKHQLTATVTSFILYKVTTANIKERIRRTNLLPHWPGVMRGRWQNWEKEFVTFPAWTHSRISTCLQLDLMCCLDIGYIVWPDWNAKCQKITSRSKSTLDRLGDCQFPKLDIIDR